MLHLNVFVPLFVFMLLPVWIPIIGTVSGKLADRIRPARKGAAAIVVAEAKAASERGRTTAREAHAAAIANDLPMAA